MTAEILAPLDERLRVDAAAQLERILADELFIAADRTARFLRYIVEQTLAGRAAEIKELVIAVEVYARSSTYDPKRDSTVRVEAGRLRAKLQRYYERSGIHDPIRITIPKGTYVPEFVRTSVAASLSRTPRSATRTSGRAWAALTLVTALTAAALFVSARPFAIGARDRGMATAAETAPSEALAAWREGNDLLRLDPHTSDAEYGMPRTLARAIDRYELAVTVSPTFARGWASLAEAYEYASAFVGRSAAQDARRAEAAAHRAVTLDPNLPEAHAMLALVRFYLRWDFVGAEAAYRRAIALDPRAAWAIVEFADLLRETNRLDEAAAEIRRARALQPALPALAVKEAELLLAQQRPEEAIASAMAAIGLKRDSPKAWVALGMSHEVQGDTERALESYRRALSFDARDRRALPALGYLLATTGRRSEAREILRRLEELNERVRVCAYQIAVVHVGLGEPDRAMEWLERAFARRQMHVPFMAVEPRFDSLRSDPRFKAVLARLNLPG
jgi:tetratricopeptide (TPR) repeat protein